MSGTANTTSIQTHIDRMVQRIEKKFHPERIILFGLQARGDARFDSNVDLACGRIGYTTEGELAGRAHR